MDARHVIQIVYTWFSFTLVQNRVCSMGLWYMTHTPKNQEMSYDNKGGKTKQESPTKFLILKSPGQKSHALKQDFILHLKVCTLHIQTSNYSCVPTCPNSLNV